MQRKNDTIMANTIWHCDCIEGMKQLEPGSVDLAFADPPFNIGYQYDTYNDRRTTRAYLDWVRRWTAAVAGVLSPTGTFWVAIGDEYAAELKLILQNDLGLTCRSWVIWYYTFGVNCKNNFSRSHTHLLYFVKNPKRFTFNDQDENVRVPSARQTKYNDTRANPKGRLPDNTWILRPADMLGGFADGDDVWHFPRVCGTFRERQGWHGCQMPERVLDRIIRTCSNVGDLVLDPFAGSGTTLAVAEQLDRRWLGFEISADYAKHALARVGKITTAKENNDS